MRLFKYIVINLIFVVSIYYGAVEGVAGAENLALFITWIMIIISPLFLVDEVIESKEIREILQNPIVPRWFDVALDLSILGAFIYYGWIITGVGYLLHILIINNVKSST